MKTKEITYVTHNLSIGGSQKVIINLANEALKENYIINIIVLTNDLYLLINIHPSANLRIFTCLEGASSKGIYNRIIIGINFLKIVRKLKPPFIHSHLWQIDVFYLILLKLFTRVQIIHTIHSPGGAYFMDSFSHRLNVYIERGVLNFGSIDLIVVSEETESVVRKVLNYKSVCYLIPNGIDASSFQRSDVEADAILIDNRVYFVFPSRYQVSKGHVLLFEAFKMLLKVHPEVYLVLIGIGLEENLRGAAENLNITDRTIFYGPTNEIDKVLSRCQFGVFPSQYEGHPIALCEMMAAGLAIVSSDIPANKFVTNNGQGAVLFKHDSADELFKGMCTVLENAGYANQLRTEAVRIVTEQFSAIKMFQLHSDLYNKPGGYIS